MVIQCSLCKSSKLNKCTLYDHLHFCLVSIIYMIVVTRLEGGLRIKSLSRNREQATIISEMDSVGASLKIAF